MSTIEELKQEIDNIKARNIRVEQDKAWEISLTRKILIITLTYTVIVLFLFISNLGNPFINAIVPSIGFFLSTLSIPVVKKWWLSKQK